MEILNAANERLYEALEENDDARKEAMRKFEILEREHSETLRKISERIIEIKQETGSGCSRNSKRSSQDSQSQKSNGSSVASSSKLTRKTTMAANVARLKTELEFADTEARKTTALKEYEDELKRFKLTKELALANAEMEAVMKTEEHERDSLIGRENLPEEIDKNFVLESHLKTQASSVTDAGNSTVETNLKTINEPLEESPGNECIPVLRNEPVTTPLQFNSNETAYTSDKKPLIPTPKSLNPLVPEFEASPFPRHDYSADLKPYGYLQPKQEREVEQMSSSPRKSAVEDSLTRLADILSQRRLQDTLPLPEPEIFSGDLLHYPVWLKFFQTIIEGQTERVSQRLYYLGKYTTGEPKEAISGLLLLETSDAYKQQKKILSDRYGNPFLVAEAYRKKINKWPKIPPNDGTSLRKFSDFLIYCQTAMNTVRYLKVLNDPDENQRMVHKLPRYLIDRWSREVDRWLDKDEDQYQSKEKRDAPDVEAGYPPFSVFCHFLQRESRIACNPVTSVRPQKEEVRKEDSYRERRSNGFNKRKPQEIGALATGFHEEESGNTKERKERKSEVTPCLLCKTAHDLDVYKQFLKKSLAERRDVIRAKALCLGCLKWGHMKRNCRRRLVRKTCNGFQPTSLHSNPVPHQNNQQSDCGNTPEATSHRVNLSDMKNIDSSGMHSLIVPVWLRHKKNTNNKLLTYALLDERSDACFVKEDLLRRLDVNGPEIELKLSTVLAEKVVKSRRVEGLVVRGYSEDVEIPLPKSYSRSSIPARESQIPRPESALNWPHLQKISEKIMPLNEDLEVGLLISLNCSRAIKPLEVIPGQEDDPYAKRTALGWGIIGAIRSSKKEDGETRSDIACNRIVTCKVQAKSDRKMCHFAFKTHVKEMFSPSDVSKMFTLDFNERQTDEKPLSVEDRRFLKIVREGVHQLEDGHYEMPLPMRSERVELLNSKELTTSRLMKLKRRLTSDDQFRKDYNSFMQDIISSGYAERVPAGEASTKSKQVWYIPHHGVYHKKKPGKIRVVFDCSAVCDGQSLNQQLLQGPDLTNNLTGVLCRFRQEQIAFMCDIQAMFHQVKVDVEHRNLLRFLWWDDPEMKRDPVEFRMTVHLFGATSSPGCANFALKTTADQYEESCGRKAADFVRRNFYVDDGLKSVQFMEEAKELIKNTKSLCQKGGFRLHKFTSNNKEVMSSVPQEDRATATKDRHLVNDVTAIERALGVHWCIESDTLQFRIIVQDKPLSRRGILSTVSSVFDPLGLVAPFILVAKRILQELCRDGVGWDDEVPDDLRPQWEKWRAELPVLESLRIARCYKPQKFDVVKNVELHHFSDACQNGYGQCS